MQNENLDITEQKKPASRMKYLQLVDYINSLIEGWNTSDRRSNTFT